MIDSIDQQMHLMSVDQLIARAEKEASIAGDAGSADVHHGRARACLKVAQIKIAQQQHVLTREQIEITREANLLTTKLLSSNEAAEMASARNAEALNSATEQLAKSTAGLNKATWILAIFTGIQVVMASLSLWFSVRGK